MGASPLDELHGATGDQPFDLARPTEERTEIDRRPIGWINAGGHVDAPAGLVVEHPEEVRRPLVVVSCVADPDRRADDMEVAMHRRGLRYRVRWSERRHDLTVRVDANDRRMRGLFPIERSHAPDAPLHRGAHHRLSAKDLLLGLTLRLVLSRNATMIEVVDGDTIDVSVGGHRERVRLIGIDTPETNKPNTPVQCYGPEASTFTKSLLPNDVPLHLERDVVARDDYGRMLAYVYLAGDGEFVNLTIIRNGFAASAHHCAELGPCRRVHRGCACGRSRQRRSVGRMFRVASAADGRTRRTSRLRR